MIRWTEKTVLVAELRPYERNPRIISDAAYERLKASLKENGYHQRIIAQPDLRVIAGHQRIRALKELGIDEVQVLVPSEELTEAQFRRVLIQDNLPFGEFDTAMLSTDFTLPELEEWGMDTSILQTNADCSGEQGAAAPTLADRFLIAPFSVLNAREGWWQYRKRQWLALGIKSELGRGGGLTVGISTKGTSTRRRAGE